MFRGVGDKPANQALFLLRTLVKPSSLVTTIFLGIVASFPDATGCGVGIVLEALVLGDLSFLCFLLEGESSMTISSSTLERESKVLLMC